jgi:hypothetical protein
MRNLKMLVLAGAIVVGLMASAAAGTASATTLTDGNKNIYGAETTLHAVSEGKLLLKTGIGNIECALTLGAKTQNEGGAGNQIFISLETVTFSECGASFAVALTKGELEIFGSTGSNGDLWSRGLEFTVEKSGFHCVYQTSSTKLGTITGSTTTGKTATVDLSASVPRTGGRSGSFCGSTGTWTGGIEIKTPDTLNIDA